tara:strand:+ start:116 stop:559 length:444 start_codon:yes stop_codon:yes gene_type:complete
MKNSRFKIRISVGGRERWADADKVFAHLFERYTKTIPSGDKPKPYKEKVENFFVNIDVEWLSSLQKAYPNVDIDTELNKAKMWLLSNTPKRNLKKFVNNWLAKAMGNKQNKQTEAVLYKKWVSPTTSDDELPTDEEKKGIINDIMRR